MNSILAFISFIYSTKLLVPLHKWQTTFKFKSITYLQLLFLGFILCLIFFRTSKFRWQHRLIQTGDAEALVHDIVSGTVGPTKIHRLVHATIPSRKIWHVVTWSLLLHLCDCCRLFDRLSWSTWWLLICKLRSRWLGLSKDRHTWFVLLLGDWLKFWLHWSWWMIHKASAWKTGMLLLWSELISFLSWWVVCST